MKSKMKKLKKMVRSIVLCSMMFVIMTLLLTGCADVAQFAWNYDDETNIIQINNYSGEEIILEISISAGSSTNMSHIVLNANETVEVNLHDYYVDDYLKTAEKEINVEEVYLSSLDKNTIMVINFIIMIIVVVLGFMVGKTW